MAKLREQMNATKLKNLKVTKVDFVDEGANPDAHILLYKRKDSSEGDGLPPEDSSGPAPEDPGDKSVGFFKKLVAFIAKAAGMGQEEIDSAMEEIEKDGSTSFNERFNEAKNRKISDEIWDLCYALQSSLCSILNDGELDSAASLTAMQSSVDEFDAVVKDAIQQWAEGKAASIVMKSDDMSEAELEIMTSARDRLTETIEKAFQEPENVEGLEGDNDMGIRIDKSKMTPAERAFYEDIEKRCSVDDGGTEPPTDGSVGKKADTKGAGSEDDDDGGEDGKGGKPAVKKSIAPTDGTVAGAAGSDPDDIYKGLHPAVRAQLEELTKYRKDTEEKELREIAKKYAIIGKKEEELVPLFKSLKAAGGTAYNDMIAVMDQAVDMVEKSGAFTEIGKAGHGSNEGGAWAEADVKAVELMKSRTGLTKAQALDEVLMADPELAKRCEKED